MRTSISLTVCALGLLAPARLAASDASAPPTGQPGLLGAEFIYETAPFPSCHASTLAESRGSLVAAWFGGTHEKHPDVGIWLARREGRKWTQPVEVANGAQSPAVRFPCWNPVLFQPQNGPLLLFYKVGPSPSAWWGMMMTSGDGGKTWARPTRLPLGVLGPIKNKPVQLPGGDLLCPSSGEQNGWRVHFERTSDLGRTWLTIRPAAGSESAAAIDAIQPSILVHGPNRLQALGRTRQGRVFETWSEDGGESWTPLALTALPNPNSGTDAVTLRDGRHLLVYNATPKGRSPLNLAVSRDGRQWEAALVLENEQGAEFSYPAIIQTADGLVHVSYTWKRQRIKHTVMDPARLSPRPLRDGEWPK